MESKKTTWKEVVDNDKQLIYNLDIIKSTDYVIDLGPEGGDKGGELLAYGTPEEVAKNVLLYYEGGILNY